MTNIPFDKGLQPERTQLAWRRTILGVAAGATLAARLVSGHAGTFAWAVPVCVGLLVGGILFGASARRARAIDAELASASGRLPGAGLLAAAVGLVLSCGLAAGVFIVAVAGGS